MLRTTAKRTLFLAVGLIGSAASGQSAGQRSAYDYALKCWAVAGYIGNQDGANAPEASGRRAFDAAYKMGSILGYGNSQIKSDLDLTATVEGTAMLRNRDYFERSRSDCRKLGLL